MMPKALERDICICLVTKDNRETVIQTVKSILFQISNFRRKSIKMMLIDKSSNNHLKQWFDSKKSELPEVAIYLDKGAIEKIEKKHIRLYKMLDYDLAIDSVQRARIQLMLATYEYRELVGNSILWQIDDDMLFQQLTLENGRVNVVINRDYFGSLLQYFAHFPDVDASIGLCSYAPPIPILLYAEKQLSDVKGGAVSNGRSAIRVGSDEVYHDLIPSNPGSKVLPVPLEPVGKLIEACLRGIPVTRPVVFGEENVTSPPQPSVLRGANFAIFNPKLVWALPHVSFTYRGIIGRRSDMIHAWMLTQIGYNIKTMQLSLFHNRSFPTVDLPHIGREYLADLIGAVAFRFLTSDEVMAWDRFEQHKAHLIRLDQLSVSLMKLDQTPLAVQLNAQVRLLIKELEKWEWSDMKASLQKFSRQVNTWLEKAPILPS